jgi:hypothetical protein
MAVTVDDADAVDAAGGETDVAGEEVFDPPQAAAANPMEQNIAPVAIAFL